MTRELVEAAKAVLDLLDPNDCELLRSGARIGEWIRATDALRAAVRAAEAAPVADTVAVPVESLRSHLNALRDERDKKWQPAAIHLAIIWMESLIPPPPAPEPSEELVAEWRKEATETANAVVDGSRCRPDLRGLVFSAAVDGYVAACGAKWVRTQNGGG